jgi:hypothetical protein
MDNYLRIPHSTKENLVFTLQQEFGTRMWEVYLGENKIFDDDCSSLLEAKDTADAISHDIYENNRTELMPVRPVKLVLV